MTRIIYPRAPITSANIKILVHGNSLAAGIGASNASNFWPTQMNAQFPLVGKNILIENHGVSGQSMFTDAGAGTMIVTAPTAIDANLVSGKINILIAHEFTIEIRTNGFNPIAAHNSWSTYCLARKTAAANAGKKLQIITMTTIPCGGDPGNGQTSINARMAGIITTNALMRLNYRSYSDILCDVAAYEPFATMYANNIWTNSAFINAGVYHRSDGQPDDSVHLGNSGYAVMAHAAAVAVSRVRN